MFEQVCLGTSYIQASLMHSAVNVKLGNKEDRLLLYVVEHLLVGQFLNVYSTVQDSILYDFNLSDSEHIISLSPIRSKTRSV